MNRKRLVTDPPPPTGTPLPLDSRSSFSLSTPQGEGHIARRVPKDIPTARNIHRRANLTSSILDARSADTFRRPKWDDVRIEGARIVEPTLMVKIQLKDGSQLYVEGQCLSPGDEEEHDIAGVVPRLDQVVQAVRGFATELGAAIKESGATKTSIEVGCEIGVEAGGGLVAIIGKATGKSSLKVAMEWSAPQR